MKKRSNLLKKCMVIALTASILLQESIPVLAAQENETAVSEDAVMDAPNTTEESVGATDEAAKQDETAETVEAAENDEVTEPDEAAETDASEETDASDQTQQVETGFILEYPTEEGNDVFIQLGSEEDVFDKLKLKYGKNGEVMECEPDDMIQNVAAFHLESDIKLLSISGLVNGQEFETSLTELDESEGEVLQVEEQDINIEPYIVENAGEEAEAVEKAATNAAASVVATYANQERAAGKKVVVIDPGHGKDSAGTNNVYNGVTYREEIITLKIAQYIKGELEQYPDVEVYLTRDAESTPSLEERVRFARDKKASMLVSVHINATDDNRTTANGVEAIVAKIGTYNTSNAKNGQDLARAILDKLVNLGFKDRGFVVKSGAETYPDGSAADYYGIIRYGQRYNVPSIIVEHGFLNNEGDFNKYLSNEAGLKSLGVADATGIANYLGATKGGAAAPGKSGWQVINGKTYYYGKDGKPVTGTPIIDGKKYWFDASGVQHKGWLYLLNWKMYFDMNSGEAKIGFADVGGKKYLFNSDGVMQNYAGTPIINGKKYWFSTDDASLKSGWLYLLNWKLYFDPVTYEAKIGIADIGGKKYLFNSDGVMQNYAGTPIINGKKYWFSTDNASLKSGWLTLGEWRLYFDPVTYQGATGWKTIDGRKYYFDSNGVLIIGFMNKGADYYYRCQDGSYLKGMQMIDGKKYNFAQTGKQIFGWYQSANGRYYFDPDDQGAAVTTEKKIGNITYYFNSDGTYRAESSTDYITTKDPANGKTYTLEKQFATDPVVDEDQFLAAAIYTESGNQSLECQIATGLVMLNRMESESYPASLRFVIYQKQQFAVTRNGSLTKILKAYKDNDQSQLKWLTKSEEAVKEAMKIMDAYKRNGTKRQIKGVTMPEGKTDFDYLGFMTPKAFEDAQLDPIKTEAFQIQDVMFYTKWIKKVAAA